MHPMTAYFPVASKIVMGCMGLGGDWKNNRITAEDEKQAQQVIEAALSSGINVFDHADIYKQGRAEEVFSRVLQRQPSLKSSIIVQSKCGIRFADQSGPKRYDLSSEWVEQSVNASLRRLGLERLDVLLLHRPDPLIDVAMLADTLDALVVAGKIKQIGVSNMHWQQIALLQQHLKAPIIVNQIQMSLLHRDWLEEAIGGGQATGTLEFCQRHGIQLQAWGCLDQGALLKEQVVDALLPAKHVLTQLSADYRVSEEAILLAWLTRLPVGVQPVIGTTSVERIGRCAEERHVFLSREHWYALLEAVRGQEVP